MYRVAQLPIFLLCIALGMVGGVLYDVIVFPARRLGAYKRSNSIIGIFIDVMFFVALAILASLATYFFALPDFRGYFWVGYCVGGIIYLKTLHKIIAFFENMCYNSIVY
jgi:hypothetical protein